MRRPPTPYNRHEHLIAQLLIFAALLIAVYQIVTHWADLTAGATPASMIDLRHLVDLLEDKRWRRRVNTFATKTRGLMKGAYHTAKEYGFCEQPINVVGNFELGYTLESHLGYAYYAHLHGCLNSSKGFAGTAAFFFFNPDHETLEDSPENLKQLWPPVLPKDNPFQRLEGAVDGVNSMRLRAYPPQGLLWPPFVDFYASNVLRNLRKPLAVVAGKHTVEWGLTPVNSFASPERLKLILDILLDNGYAVLYNRPKAKFEGDSLDQKITDPGDLDMIRADYKNKDVIVFQDLAEKVMPLGTIEPSRLRYNVLLLSLYAHARLFGGNSVIASLFPGDNFIYHIGGHEALEYNVPPKTTEYIYHHWTAHGGSRAFPFGFFEEMVDRLNALTVAKTVARLEALGGGEKNIAGTHARLNLRKPKS